MGKKFLLLFNFSSNCFHYEKEWEMNVYGLGFHKMIVRGFNGNGLKGIKESNDKNLLAFNS